MKTKKGNMRIEKTVQKIWANTATNKRRDAPFQIYKIATIFALTFALIVVCTIEILQGKGFK